MSWQCQHLPAWKKAVECSLFLPCLIFSFQPVLANLPILQSDNLTFCNLTALSPLTNRNHLINNSLLHIIATGQTVLESSGQKVLKAKVYGKVFPATRNIQRRASFPIIAPRKGNWGTISKPHLCRCRTFDNHQRWQTHNVEKSLSKIEKPSWANKRQFWKHLNDDCSQGIIVVCKSCPYHGVEIVRTLQCGSSFNQISTQFSSFLSCVHQLRLSANHATHTVKTSDPSSAPAYHAYTTAASYKHATRTRALSRQVIPVILFYISDNQ